MKLFSNKKADLKKTRWLIIAATFFSFLSFAILFLEYCVFNFGDSDLAPYQPDTLFEKAVNVVWFAVIIISVLLWFSFVASILRALLRHVFQPVAQANSALRG